jgi:hypothetical protein
MRNHLGTYVRRLLTPSPKLAIKRPPRISNHSSVRMGP